MKVREIMTTDARFCELNESLAEAAKTMWDADCGVLPVLKDGQEVVGLITDRDICMAMAMRDANPAAISAEEVLSGVVYAVTPEDEVNKALELMKEHRVRRLPVLGPRGELEGMLSMNDVVLHADGAGRAKAAITYADVVDTYKAICAHPVSQQQTQGAVAGV